MSLAMMKQCVGEVKFCQIKKRKGRWLLLDCYALASTILAIGAFFFIDSMPLTHASFDSYASPTAIVCPFGDTRRNLNFPALSLYHSNFGSGNNIA